MSRETVTPPKAQRRPAVASYRGPYLHLPRPATAPNAIDLAGVPSMGAVGAAADE